MLQHKMNPKNNSEKSQSQNNIVINPLMKYLEQPNSHRWKDQRIPGAGGGDNTKLMLNGTPYFGDENVLEMVAKRNVNVNDTNYINQAPITVKSQSGLGRKRDII